MSMKFDSTRRRTKKALQMEMDLKGRKALIKRPYIEVSSKNIKGLLNFPLSVEEKK